MESNAPAEATTTPVAASDAPAAAPAASSAPDAPVAAPEPSKPASRADTLRAAIQAAKEPSEGKSLREKMIANGTIRPAAAGERQRAPDGKFVAAQQAQKSAATPAPTQAQTIAMPKSLRKELEAHWTQTPAELQKAINEREAAYERGVAQYRTQAEQAQALLSEFKPYENIMRMTGGTPQTALRSILPTMAVLTTGAPQEKAFVIAKAMQQYGVPIEHIAQVMQGGAGAVQAHQDPMLAQLAQQVNALTQTFQTQQQAHEQAENARLASIAENFGAGKEHFNTLRPQMWSVLQAQSLAEQQGIPGPLGSGEQTAAMTEAQWVEAAYNAALRLNPELYESELTRQREEAARTERDKATAAAQAARSAAVQVRGAPAPSATTSAINPRDRAAVIRSAMRAIPR